MVSEKVYFQNSEDVGLSGVLERPDGEVLAWAIFAHCFTCSKKSLAASRIARGLAERGIGVLRFDFTGLGESEGEFSETGFSSNVSDLLAAAQWMSKNDRTVSLLVGHSLGGAAVIVAANQLTDVLAVATLGAPSDADHVIAQFRQAVPEITEKGEATVQLADRDFVLKKSFLDDVHGANVRNAARSLGRPLLVMHAPSDEIVGIDNATNLFLAAKHPKSFVSLDDANHLLTSKEDADFAVDVISGWARRYVGRVDPGYGPVPQTHEVIVQETGAASAYQNAVYVDGRRYLADEPVSFGGSATGPDPYAWVTAGLGACTSMTLRMYAERKEWPLERVSVYLTHEKQHLLDCKDCGPRDKIDVFIREIELDGPLDEAQRARLLEIADRCPVHRTLESEAVIQTRAVIQSA